MERKIIKWAFMKWIYPELKEYVDSTDNEYDDKALQFVVDVIDILVVKVEKAKQEIASI